MTKFLDKKFAFSVGTGACFNKINNMQLGIVLAIKLYKLDRLIPHKQS